ncbi:MAG TPA: POTRA domain-containing protein [Chitinophagaceae bacterium]|nr:POTRA domain-containing protein [Chitinophagaceae bacterium]
MKLLQGIIIVFFNFITALSFAQEDTLSKDSTLLHTHKSNDTTIYTIGSIVLKGNKKTKNYIVFREVPFKEGDVVTPAQLTEKLELAREQIMNTALFVDATVYVSYITKNIASINIDLKERWYIFPLPYFKLIDRNFNQWWFDQNRSLDRVNYGLKFFQHNVSGRNDKVSLDVVTGYNRQIALNYSQPFADKTLKHGFGIGFSYNKQREMNYATLNNKQAFFKLNDGFVREAIRATGTYSYRPDSKYRFYASFTYAKDIVNDTILKLNPQYLPANSGNTLAYLSAATTLQYYGVDYIPFPKKGFMYEVGFFHRGFKKSFNITSLSLETTNAITLTKNSFVQFHNYGVVRFNANQPFYNMGLLGYGDSYLRGMENYVIDGTAGFLSNTTFYKKLFTYIFKNPIKSKSHDKIPFSFYLKAFGDLAFVHNSNPTITNNFHNRLLRTAGIGLDIVSIYDFVFRLEYSFNQFGDKGFAFRTRGDF